ncbi:MAG: hypothetical protein L0177_19375 [Chloroflexi bacterium]|nr:hypothetical protein [Chloroflexota bacterium]
MQWLGVAVTILKRNSRTVKLNGNGRLASILKILVPFVVAALSFAFSLGVCTTQVRENTSDISELRDDVRELRGAVTDLERQLFPELR